ncbi:MAG: hemZ [Bacillales bacterium]|jgi:oxygen-independent coproporphyrinogen-3 oxidase|nr:hemZ [Bacillales bacterium]
MKIGITGISDEKLRVPLMHIANLFFENSLIKFNELEDIDIKVSLEDKFNFASPRERKYAILRKFLEILQEVTGRTQKWGVLTGIRPTKLWHQMVREAVPHEVARNLIKADYLITDEKLAMLERIVDRQLEVVPDLYNLKGEVSIYIGIPFCPTKCAYCTFPAYAIQLNKDLVSEFLEKLHMEIRAIGEWLLSKGMAVTTVYFGGGTPTSISAEQMDALYTVLYESIPNIESVREITVEAGRPDTLSNDKLEVLKKWNINRISINPQSFHEETLKAIGRHHTAMQTIDKFKIAREYGFENINMDLIIGLPGEGVTEFKKTLNQLEELQPESITVHTLAFKRASDMTLNKEKYRVAGDDEIEIMMQESMDWMAEHHYEPYYLYRQQNILGNLENIGYSKRGQESIYNILIMEEVQTIIGLGCGASSKYIHPESGVITRYANPKDPKAYIENVDKYTTEKLKHLNDLFRK